MKKILSLISISLIGVLLVLSIISIYVPKNYNVGLSNPTYINVYEKGTDNIKHTLIQDSETYKELLDIFNNSFEISSFTAITKGIINKKPQVIEEYLSNVGNYMDYTAVNSFFIEFNYDVQQQVKVNGVNFVNSSGEEKFYNKVVAEISNVDGFVETNYYIKRIDSQVSYYRFTTYANQTELYSYLTNLTN